MFLHFPKSLYRNRELLWRFTDREIKGRHRGSLLGVGWSFLTPLAMLAVYTLVFSQVFKARWGTLEESGALGFAINLFAGLIVFNLFAECINRAGSLITSNTNYVKKVIFPLEILGAVTVGTAMFHAMTSLVILIIFKIIADQHLAFTVLWLPIIWIPLILGTLACTWLLSAAGVFLRDISQIAGLGLNMLMFLSPIFFPIAALPEKLQPFLMINPLAIIIEQTRLVLIRGASPSITYIFFSYLISIAICEYSYRIFSKFKRSFADVM